MKQFTIKILAFFFVLSFVHCPFSIPVYAIENDIGYSKIHPASFFYFLKSIREGLELKLAQTYRVKELRQLEFATRRLREAKTLISIHQEDLVQPTLERYISHLNNLTDHHQKDPQFGVRIGSQLAIHLAVLEKIYNESAHPRTKMAIRSAMNRIINRADTPNFARLPICGLFGKEATSASLNQTEKMVLQQRTTKCSLNVLKTY